MQIPTRTAIGERLDRKIDDNTSYLNVKGGVNQDNPGFIHPDNINSFFCDKCGKTIRKVPDIEVYIHDRSYFGDEQQQIYANVRYSHVIEIDGVKHLHDICSHDVPVSELDKVPVEFIEYDGTGDYKTPTPEAIEDVFKYAEKIASRGGGMDLKHVPCWAQINLIRRWAGKIGYEVSEERINSLREIHRKAYVAKFQENLPDFIKRMQLSAHDVQLKQLSEVLPYLELGDEMKIKIAEIFYSNYTSTGNRINLLEKEKSTLEEKIGEAEAQQHEAKILLNEAVNKLGLTKEQRKTLPPI